MSKWDFVKKMKTAAILQPTGKDFVFSWSYYSLSGGYTSQAYLGIAPHNTWKNVMLRTQRGSSSGLVPKINIHLADSSVLVANSFVATRYNYAYFYHSSKHYKKTSKVVTLLEAINTLSHSTIFCQTVLPNNMSDFLRINEDYLGNSSAHLDVALLNGWTYNQDGYSQRIMIYIIKIVESGSVGTAKFVWTKMPLIFQDSNHTSDSYSSGRTWQEEYIVDIYYSEIAPLLKIIYNEKTYFVHRLPCQGEDNLIYYGTPGLMDTFFGLPVCQPQEVVYAETRRRNPDKVDEYISTALADCSGQYKLIVYDAPGAIPFAVLAEIDLPFAGRALGWMNGKFLVLSEDMKLYFVQLDGSITHLIDTDIDPEADNMFFFVHPDQDYGYLIGMSEGIHKQYIVDGAGEITVKNVELPDYGQHCFLEKTLAFDEDGNIWIRNKKYNKQLELLYEHPCDVKVNYTHFVAYDGENYKLFDIDGNEINNSSVILFDVWNAGHLFTYSKYIPWVHPQAVVIPLNREDLKWLSRNGSLDPDQMYWLGWDEENQEWVEYDGTNARTVEEVVEIQDGVELHFDDENGALEYAEGDYFYFVVGYGIIKDMYSDAEFKLEFDLRDREEHTIDIYVDSTSYQIPEASDELFWGISDLIIEATWDHSDPVELVKGDTTPEQDKVGYDPATGTFYFNELDFNRTFQCRYIVYKEPAI